MAEKTISQIKIGSQIYTLKDSNIKLATDTVAGLIQLGYGDNGKNYRVQIDNDGKAFVNVPWDAGTDHEYKTTFNGTLLGSTNGTSLGSWYAPIGAGSTNQILKSNGTGAPSWIDFPKAADGVLGGVILGYADNEGKFGVQKDPTTEKAFVSITVGTGAAIGSATPSTAPALWSPYELQTWMNDILGVNISGVETLINILKDNDPTTGLLTEINNKVNKTDIVTYNVSTGLAAATNGKTVTFSVKLGAVDAANVNNIGKQLPVQPNNNGDLVVNLGEATTGAAGLLSSADKTKINYGLTAGVTGEVLELMWGTGIALQA